MFTKIRNNARNIYVEGDWGLMWDYLREQVNNGNISYIDAEYIADDILVSEEQNSIKGYNRMNKKYPCKTKVERAKAHTRALARKARYNGHIECWYDPDTKNFQYHEIVGLGYMADESDSMIYICSEDTYD